jgi:membrane protease YdiL (CAAX protease family)
MNRKQIIAVILPLILIVIMYPVFQLLSAAFNGSALGWYLGLATYWIIWGVVFPLWIVGMKDLRPIIRPRKLNIRVFVLIIIPLILALIYKFITGMDYGKLNFWILILYISTSFGNGFFEEVLWRGVYMKLFPDNILFRIVWPSIWFALWHYAPGSVSPNANVFGLIIGSGLFGFYLSFLAKKTGTIWWSIVTHILGGIIMVI